MRAALTGRSRFIIVCDIGHCFDLYATFDGTSNYRPFPNAQASRIFLRDLAEHADTLRRVFEEPLDLDPSRHSMKVTRGGGGAPRGPGQETGRRRKQSRAGGAISHALPVHPVRRGRGPAAEGIFTKALKEQWLPIQQRSREVLRLSGAR